VRDLTAAGVVAVRAVTDPLRLGFAVMALVGVSAGGDVERVGRLVAAREEASFVVATTGPYDLLVELACVDRRHLLEAVERLHATEGVDAIETFMYLSLEKESFVWGGAEGDGAPASA
jgi:Lrp/AsnC family transcriptional regulator, regulator for asnA, asnC and gidA